MSISLSKCPMLPTMALFFIRDMRVDGDHVHVAGRRHEEVGRLDDVLERGDLVALHRRLQRADRVDLGDDHACALTTQRLRAALAHVAVAAHHGDLARQHHVGGAADAVDQRVATAVEVVELALGDRVVDVDGGEQQRARSPSSGRGGARRWWSPRSRPSRPSAMRCHRRSSSASTSRRRPRTTANSSLSAVDGSGTAPARSNSTPLCTSSVASPPSSRIMFGPVLPVPSAGHDSAAVGAPPVLLERLALPGEHRDAAPRRSPRRRGPGWRRCCRTPSAPRRRVRPGSR